MSFDGFVDEDLQDLHRNLNVEAILGCQFSNALLLTAFARRVRGSEVVLALIQANLIRDFETLRQKRDQTFVQFVQMLSQNIELWIVHRHTVYTPDTVAASTT